MKTKIAFAVLALLGLVITGTLRADPLLTSWFTTYSGRYARIYTTSATETNGISSTTWTNGTTSQAYPAYCGVQEVDYSSSWVYIRSTGLGSHIMGPWYLDAAHTTLFPDYPINEQVFYRIPRSPTVPTTKTANGGGPIGYFVDGAAMFNSWDAYYWSGTADTQSTGGSGYWNRDAYVNEGVTFDPNNAHQANGQYHYHANPPALRYLLGDHVNFSSVSNAYTEATNTPTKHSPILGWVSDGFPIYGPYGYSNPTNPASGIRRMISGYVIRNGQYGTSNLTANGRTTIPLWATRLLNNPSGSSTGPAVSTSYPLGRYMEDNDYLGDLGYTQGVDFDLDQYNCRFCVTPEFPNGTNAYFVAISSNGTPVFPYNIGRGYYGNPTGSNVTTLTETVTTNFLGGPNLSPVLNAPKLTNGTVTLTWSATEGGTYLVASSTNLTTWTTNSTNVSAVLNNGGYTNSSPESQKFFRVARTALASYDPVSGSAVISGGGGGGGTTSVAPGGSASRGTTVTVTITLPTTPPQPPAANVPTSVVLAGSITGTSIQKPSQGTVIATFVIPSNASTGAQNIVITFSPAPTYTMTGAFTIN